MGHNVSIPDAFVANVHTEADKQIHQKDQKMLRAQRGSYSNAKPDLGYLSKAEKARQHERQTQADRQQAEAAHNFAVYFCALSNIHYISIYFSRLWQIGSTENLHSISNFSYRNYPSHRHKRTNFYTTTRSLSLSFFISISHSLR